MLSAVTGLEVVTPAQNATEALAHFESFQPQLVILDLQMPGGSGLGVLQQIKQERPETRVVIFTNHLESQYRSRCSELKADYFLSKSTDAKLLIEISKQLTVGLSEENG